MNRCLSYNVFSGNEQKATFDVIHLHFILPIPVAERSKADRFLGLRVRIPPEAWMFVLCCCTVRTKGKARTIRTKKYR